MCDLPWHARLQECKALNVDCRKCGIKGHFEKVYQNSEKATNFLDAPSQNVDVFFCGQLYKPDHFFVNIEGYKTDMGKDTGATCSLI